MPTIRKLPQDLADEIKDFQRYGAEFVPVDQTAPPADIVRAIKEKVGELRDEGRTLDEDEIVGLGVLLGEQYVRRFGWHWAHVNHDDDFDEDNYYVCVLPADNALSINPIAWVSWIVSGEKNNNILLNFNMVAAGNVPNARANDAIGFH